MRIVLFLSFLLLSGGNVLASHVEELYDVDILVTDETKDTRWRALEQGLDEVFVRISGDSIIMKKLKRPASGRYVKQFSYEPVAEPKDNKKGEKLTSRLKIQYNGSAMEKYLLDNGFPVWGKYRPDLVVWLAVRDGKNEYVLKDTDRSLMKTAADEALSRRGLPERWPLYDVKDRKILSVADIRGGFNDPVTKASKRYSRGPALAGSMTWSGKQWRSSWNLMMESGNQHWSIDGADYKLLINKAVDQAADALGVVYALHTTANNQQLVTVRLYVQAVSTIEKYRRVEDYLKKLNVVENATPLKVDGENAIFEVTLLSTEEDFINLIHNDAELVETEAVKPEVIEPEVEVPEVEVMEPKAIKPGTDIASNTESNQLADGQVSKVDSENVDKNAASSDDAEILQKQQHQTPVYYYKFMH